MTDLEQHQLWAARNLVRRADMAAEAFGATGWMGSAAWVKDWAHSNAVASQIHGAGSATDEWQFLANGGHWQDPETRELRMGPFILYPGVVLAPLVEEGIVPQPNHQLWVRVSCKLGSASFYTPPSDKGPGSTHIQWDGTILDTEGQFIWAPKDKDLAKGNTYIERHGDTFMPPGNILTRYAVIGFTDRDGIYERSEIFGLREACGMWAPPF